MRTTCVFPGHKNMESRISRAYNSDTIAEAFKLRSGLGTFSGKTESVDMTVRILTEAYRKVVRSLDQVYEEVVYSGFQTMINLLFTDGETEFDAEVWKQVKDRIDEIRDGQE